MSALARHNEYIRYTIEHLNTAFECRLNTLQLNALRYIKNSGPVNIEEIAKNLGTCEPHAQGKINVMVKRGYLTKSGHMYSVRVIK